MQLRPSHPVAAPAPLRDAADPKGKGKGKAGAAFNTNNTASSSAGVNIRKRKSTSATAAAALARGTDARKRRARILTIDPTRYPRSHLTGLLLEGGADDYEEEEYGAAGFGRESPRELMERGWYWECMDGQAGETSDSEEEAESGSEHGEGSGGRRAAAAPVPGDKVRWVLRDRERNIIREELLPRPAQDRARTWSKRPNGAQADFGTSTGHEQERAREEDPEQSSSSEESSSSSSSDDESESGEEEFIIEEIEPSSAKVAVNGGDEAKANESSPEWHFEKYDPAAESDFSEGYGDEDEEEGENAIATPATLPPATPAERSSTMNVLAKMFGTDVAAAKQAPAAGADAAETAADANEDDDEEEDDYEELQRLAATARNGKAAAADEEPARAASPSGASSSSSASSSVSSSSVSSSSVSSSDEEASDEEEQHETEAVKPEELLQIPQAEKQTQAELAAPSGQLEVAAQPDTAESSKVDAAAKTTKTDTIGMQYQLDSLKDMFKPQEPEKLGFSLMADLDVELDEEMNFDLQVEQQEQHAVHSRETDGGALAPSSSGKVAGKSSSSSAPQSKLHSFPLFDPRNPADPINALQQGFYIPFWRTDSEEAIEQRWEDSKAGLTQQYRRRHREALRKKKRKVTGARAGNTAGGAIRGGTGRGD